jgi:predicted ABC-class ATPase
MEELYKILKSRKNISVDAGLLTLIVADYESRPYKEVHVIMDKFKKLALAEGNQEQIDNYIEQLKTNTRTKFPMCEE